MYLSYYFTLDKIFSKLPSFCETAGVWNRGEKKDNKNEEILKPVSKTIVPGNEQCQSFQKNFKTEN